jgi:serine/threonine protein kinase
MDKLKKKLNKIGYEIIDKKYFDRGGHGQLFKCKNIRTDEICAVKLEKKKEKYESTLLNEMKIYGKIDGNEKKGIPKIYDLGKTDDYYYIIMKLYHKNIDDLKSDAGSSFSLRTTLQLGINIFKILERLHSQNIIHRDIKPENIMVDKKNNVYLIDYGLAKKFTNLNNQKLFKKEASKSRCGTVRYMSIGCHQKTRLSRKDDLLSLGYVLIYLYVGNLPWQGLDISDRKEKDSAVSEIKQYYGYKKLCETLPIFFKNYFNEIEQLSQSDKPNYSKIKQFFKKELYSESFHQKIDYDWSVNE